MVVFTARVLTCTDLCGIMGAACSKISQRKFLTFQESSPIIVYIMKETKETKKRVSKKALIKEIAQITGRPLYEFDSLSRANIQTIQWVKSLIS